MSHVPTKLRSATLDDKFELDRGTILLNGKQALARVTLLQSALDRAKGWRTAGYVSGYRGSPLGTIDTEFLKIGKRLAAANIVFESGLNEDLAMTAVWGSQQIGFVPKPKYDGVFAVWYGKGPGVDRSGDAIKHANMAGTHPKGGVLLAFGDDHPGKSSSTAHQSDLALAAHDLAILYPSDVSDVLRFGTAGIAMSRYSGLVVGLKFVNETADSTQAVDLDIAGLETVVPDAPELGDQDVGIRAEFFALQAQDQRIVRRKLPRAKAFARANGLDRHAFGAAVPKMLGIVTAGKPYQDVLEALRLLGVDEETARTLGIGVLKVGLIYPLDETGLLRFGADAKELMFVEEKRAHMEPQAAAALYNTAVRPAISGKHTPDGEVLLRADEPLDALIVAESIGRRIVARLAAAGLPHEPFDAAMARIRRSAELRRLLEISPLVRRPAFCSGCPHNLSTKVPEGSFGVAGIGCHGLVQFMDRNPLPCTHMGAEGVNWVGLSHFTDTEHVFVNLGDGTFSHSGSLAIRAAARSRANVTFKILVNDIVAMTGGQQVESGMPLAGIVKLLQAEGVPTIVVVAEDVEEVKEKENVPVGIEVIERRELETVQRRMRDTKGVSVILFVQDCATEKRKRRKRGSLEKPIRNVVINAAVCEGCGDCSRASNCMSVQPLETEFGRKRRIDQSSCNGDTSCLEGFCPSFVSIDGGTRRKKQIAVPAALLADLPLPSLAPVTREYGIMFAGVGGTGVVTASAIVGMAAHLQGLGVNIYDMTGLAQKGGAVYSHMRLFPAPNGIAPLRLGVEDADAMIACDLVAAVHGEALQTVRPGHTKVVVNTDVQAPQAFHERPDIDLDAVRLVKMLDRRADAAAVRIATSRMAERMFGDSIPGNMMLVGAAYQLGAVPISLEAIAQAIRLNGGPVESNITAFAIGRLAVASPETLAKVLGDAADDEPPVRDLAAIVARRVEALTAYQNAAYAERFSDLVARVAAKESAVAPGSSLLAETVARNAYALMAYKDEYEIARMLSGEEFIAEVRDQFEGGRLGFHLSPPLLAGWDAATGRPRKYRFGAWMLPVFRTLARMKPLRGTAFDPFGYTRERRTERALREGYFGLIEELVEKLDAHGLSKAIEQASWPQEIRGYGPVKEASIEVARRKLADLQARPVAAASETLGSMAG